MSSSIIIHPTAPIRRQAGQKLDHMDTIFRKVVRFSMDGKVRAFDNWLLTVLPLFMTNRYFNMVVGPEKTIERIPSLDIFFQKSTKHPGEIYGGPSREVYTASMSVRIRTKDGNVRIVPVCRMPIVVGCVLCPLKDASMEDKMRAGFNPIMPLGFFIAKNSPFFTCIQERVARAKILSYPDKGRVITVFNLVSDKSVNHHFLTVFYETKSGSKKLAPTAIKKGSIGDDAPTIKFSLNLMKVNAAQPTPWREFNAVTVAFILYLFTHKKLTDVKDLTRVVEDDVEFERFISSFFIPYFTTRGASAIVGQFYPNFVHDALSIAIAEASVAKDRSSVLGYFLAGESFTEDSATVSAAAQRGGSLIVDRMRKLMSCSDVLFEADTAIACLFERAFPDSPGISKLFTYMDILLSHCTTLFKCVFPSADLDDPSSVPPDTYNIKERLRDAAKHVLDNRNNLDSKDSMELDIMVGKAFYHRCHNSFCNEGEMISWNPNLSTNMDATVAKQSWKQQTAKDDTIAAVSRSSVTRALAANVKTSSHSSKHGGTAGNIETRMLSADAAGNKCVHDTPHNANIGTSESIASTAVSSRIHPTTYAFFLARNALSGCDEQVLDMPTPGPRFVEDDVSKVIVPQPFKHYRVAAGREMANFTLGIREAIPHTPVVALAQGIVGISLKPIATEVDLSSCQIPITIDGLTFFYVSKDRALEVFMRLFKAFKHNPTFFDTVVNFNRLKMRIEIIVAGGKLMRPLVVKDKLQTILAVERGELDMSLEQLIVAGAIAYLSPIEEGMFLIADHPGHHSFARATFVEIHTLYLYSIIAGPAPFSDNCQQSRLTLQCAMNKQAIIPAFGTDTIVETGRFGMFGSLPACVTQLSDIIGEHYNPHGSPVVVISAATTSTYEDGIMVNEDFLGLLKYISLRVHRYTRRDKVPNITTGHKYNSTNPLYSKLEEDGMPRLGTLLGPGDVVFHGVSNVKAVESVIDETLPNGVSGFVIHKNTLDKEYYIMLAEYRQPYGGDKGAFDDAQKGVITRIVPSKDMPVVMSGPHKGMKPHIFFGILSIPSRMTPGMTRQLNEGIPAILGGYRIDASPTIRDPLVTTPTKTYFVKYRGNPMIATMGIIHHVMLPHISADKVQCVSQIRMLADGTPARGRYRKGALRDGSMEKDAQITHGISWSHWDGFFARSDGCYNAICPKCKANLNKVRPKAMDVQNTIAYYECINSSCPETTIHREDVVWLMSSAALHSLKSTFASVGIDFSYSAIPLK